MDFDELAEAQGWNNDTLTGIMRGFISNNGLSEELAVYAQEIADEENEGQD